MRPHRATNGQQPPLANHIRYAHSEYVDGRCYEQTFGAAFGDVHSVTPISIPGLGHIPHVEVRFTHGLRLDFSPEVVAELARRFPEALAKLPCLPAIHDAIGGDA